MFRFIGIGSASTLKDFNSNAFFSKNGKNMLIDCGMDIRFSLARAGLKAKDINAVYISHLHADHIGGLEWLAFNIYFIGHRVSLYISSEMVNKLWRSLKSGLSCLEGKQANLTTYFDVCPVKSKFNFEGVDFSLVQCVHVLNENEIMPSYGLHWENEDKKYFLTTDTQFCPHLKHWYNKSDVIFHDCETGFRSGVHAHYDDLKTLPDATKKKMYLYHCGDTNLPDAFFDGFAGYATPEMVW